MTIDGNTNATKLIAFVVLSVAVAGYFTGLQSPMRTLERDQASLSTSAAGSGGGIPTKLAVGVVPAADYSDMSAVSQARRSVSQLASLKSTIDPLAEIKITEQDKLAALQQRETNRAFNGAPPTIPHPIDQRSDASCVACHSKGIVTSTIRVPKMSHQFLQNCTQCHVENNPKHMAATIFRENEFVGLEAPTAGPRAYAGAPPQIPHSTWMRSDCLSCHGLAGRYGIRTTHPWRNNCQQCHAPSAKMDQTLLTQQPQFLPGPTVKK